MNIFLTSQAARVMDEVVKKFPRPQKGMKLAFIPTAGDPYGGNKPWMDADRAKLVDLGFEVEDFDLKGKTEAEVREALEKVDVIFVAGGNTFHLLNEANKSGFSKVVPELVKKGTIYIGSSAGSYIACPSIVHAGWKHADRNQVGLKDLTGLGLVDFLVVCHYESKWKEIVEAGRKSTPYPVRAITDEEFIEIR
jgi:dipeptidase E